MPGRPLSISFGGPMLLKGKRDPGSDDKGTRALYCFNTTHAAFKTAPFHTALLFRYGSFFLDTADSHIFIEY